MKFPITPLSDIHSGYSGTPEVWKEFFIEFIDNYEKFRITSKFEMLKYLKQVQEEHVSLSLVFIKNDQNILKEFGSCFSSIPNYLHKGSPFSA